ncbi:hypothetical protein Pst134EA_024335 [Puccinia striiformis f. sp. tritici]|uniref:Uncharacterized protein n=1 Tax=Puccinia striiformis f. sp. tritici PST-78 TaxID=1165861 RepID=A0A0L0VDR2_9BASI|nr:hypothetical protein Pst134EA_024335 [Puccinia striiformis f. sp. tritici]KAH9453460.1 hypothetical protein Pst134EA_024335 [Puccinia striiformis f. sp. tritici]KAI9614494.1 hypothetical protein KEM48_005959 [Puccinia striiformis f. sp. tritici PST-130]KNE97331.1 hypothetical protein PSTG_09442 [Puccinia striiformis f. sp. tritici PST-78]
MAPSLSTLKKQSHPFFGRGPFDITTALAPIISSNSTYGQLPAESGITFNDIESGAEVNMKVKVNGYGSSSMALLQDKLYLLSGRIIAPNVKAAPILYYDQDLVFPIGDSEGFPVSLANKTAVVGYGIVVSKKEFNDSAPGQAQFKSLHVVLKHTDYDNQARVQVVFYVSYKISGNRNLAKTFGLFQPGREMVLSGYLIGYDRGEKMLQVHTLSVSLSAGFDANVGSDPEDKAVSPQQGRKHFQIDFDSDEDPTAPVPGPSNTNVPGVSSTDQTTDNGSLNNPTPTLTPAPSATVVSKRKTVTKKAKLADEALTRAEST